MSDHSPKEIPVHRPRRLLPIVLVLSLPLGACVTWQPVTTSPAQLMAEESPERVRITTRDGTLMTLEAPVIRAGAMVGTLSPGAALLDDIETLEVERTSVVRTVLLTVPAAIVMLAVALASCRDAC